MKIVMLVNNTCKYDSRVIREATSLSKSGHELVVFAFSDENTPLTDNINGFIIKRISPKNNKKFKIVFNLFTIFSYLRYYHQVLIRIKSENADVCHFHDLPLLPLGAMVKLLKKSKIIYDSHELYIEQASISKYMKPLLKFIEKLMIKSADKVITVNEFIASELSARYRITEPTVIKNCPPLILEGTGHHIKDVRIKLNLGSDTCLILYSGSLSKGRGLNNMILASKYIENSVFIFLGSGSYRTNLQEMV